jgi:uroporphyrinogen-III synthase
LQAVQGRPEKSVAVQEYGRTNEELVNGLKSQGRTVTTVPVYQWKLPEDTAALAEAVRQLIGGNFAAAVFTTGVQIDHLLDFAGRNGQAEECIGALRKIFIASVGPDTSEALRSHGIEPTFVASHAKMGVLIQEAARAFAAQKA